MEAQTTPCTDHYGSKVATTALEGDLNHCGYHLTPHRLFKIITENRKKIALSHCINPWLSYLVYWLQFLIA